jgi:hypothetical protein
MAQNFELSITESPRNFLMPLKSMTTPSPEFIYDVLSEFVPAIQAELERDYRFRPNDRLRELIDDIKHLSIDNAVDLLNDLFSHPTVDSYSRYLSNSLADEIIGRFFDGGFVPTYLSGTNPATFQSTPVQFVLSPNENSSGLTESGTLVTPEDVTPPESPRSQTPPLSSAYPVARPDIGTGRVPAELIPPFPVYAQTWRQTPPSAYRELPIDTYNVRQNEFYDGRPNWPSYSHSRRNPNRYPDRHHEIQTAISRSGLRSSSRYYR